MNRAQRIRAACVVLGSRDEDEIARFLTAIDMIDKVNTGFHTLYSKQTKLKVQALHKALRRVQAAYNALPLTVQAMDFADFDLKKYLAACDNSIAEPSSPTKLPATKQRQAAALAALLLHFHGLPCLASSRSKWCQLAALLCDEPKAANMLPYCREILRFRREIK